MQAVVSFVEAVGRSLGDVHDVLARIDFGQSLQHVHIPSVQCVGACLFERLCPRDHRALVGHLCELVYCPLGQERADGEKASASIGERPRRLPVKPHRNEFAPGERGRRTERHVFESRCEVEKLVGSTLLQRAKSETRKMADELGGWAGIDVPVGLFVENQSSVPGPVERQVAAQHDHAVEPLLVLGDESQRPHLGVEQRVFP